MGLTLFRGTNAALAHGLICFSPAYKSVAQALIRRDEVSQRHQGIRSQNMRDDKEDSVSVLLCQSLNVL